MNKISLQKSYMMIINKILYDNLYENLILRTLFMNN